MAHLTTQEQILIELKRQNALLEEQLRPQREADARKKKQVEIRQSPKFLALAAKRSSLLREKAPYFLVCQVESYMRKMLDV